MKSLFKIHILEILVIFILSLTPLLWFVGDSMMLGHDNTFPLKPITFLEGRMSTWIDHGFGQGQDLMIGTAMIPHLIDAIPAFLGFGAQATQKMVYVFWFFVMGCSVYILARQFREQSWVFRLLAVILYQFNYFILQGWWIGERTKFSAYVALPLILTVFIKVYKGELKVIHGVIINSLILFIFNAGGLFGVPLYGGMFIVLGVFILFFSFLSIIHKQYHIVKRFMLLTIFTILGYLIVNSYFLLPTFNKLHTEYASGVSNVGGIDGLLEWADVISENASFMNLFRLQGIPEWYDNPEHPYAKIFLKNPFFIALSFVWPILIILALTGNYKLERRKIIIFFFLVFLIGVFFSSGTHRPFGVVYEAFIRYVPGFVAFRSPYFKFASAIFFAATFLIAFYADSFQGKKKYVFFALMTIFVFFYHFPFFTGNIFSWKKGFSTRLTIPTYVTEFGDWIEKEKNDDGRVLFLPPNSPNWRYSIYDWGYLSFQALPTLVSNKSTVINNDRLNDNERKLVEALYTAFSDDDKQSIHKLSGYLGIQYFLIQEDAIPGDIRSPFLLQSQPYKDIIEQKLQLKLTKKFGRWSLYKLDKEALPMFYTVDNMTIISGPVNNFSYYYDFLEEERVLLKSDDLQAMKLDSLQFPDIYSPTCLKCRKKDRPFIAFPDRNVLPNSPFYQLVLLSEARNLRPHEPRNLVYDYLGLSLKRLGEMNEMIEKDIPIPDEVLNRYESMIRLILTNFNKLSRVEDRYSTAEDLTYYIRSQRDVIHQTLAQEVSGLPAVILERSLRSLRTLEEGIQPYIFTADITQNRLLSLSVAQPSTYSLYVRSRDFESLVKNDAKITVQIDGYQTRTLSVSDAAFQQEWFSFGDFALGKGDHAIHLSFSELENVVSAPEPSINAINPDGRQRCFVTRVRNYDNSKRYKAVVRYRNDLFNDIGVYVWEEKEKESRLRYASRLFKSLVEEEFTHEVDPQSDIKGIVLGFCSANLTQEFLRERFNIKVSELTEPVVLFLSKKKQDVVLEKVSYEKISHTKYVVSFSAILPNSILVFNSRFDKDWELQGFSESHVPVNGFANGWIIDKPGNYVLTLVYNPQKTVYLGGLLSFATVIGGVAYLLWVKISRSKK